MKCIFLGYNTQFKAYRLYNPMSAKMIINRNVVFDEEASCSCHEKLDDIQFKLPTENEAPPTVGQHPIPLNTLGSFSSTSRSSTLSNFRNKSSSEDKNSGH